MRTPSRFSISRYLHNPKNFFLDEQVNKVVGIPINPLADTENRTIMTDFSVFLA